MPVKNAVTSCKWTTRSVTLHATNRRLLGKYGRGVMRHFILSGASILAMVISVGNLAHADDPKNSKTGASADAAAAVNWTGFYIGGDIGGASQHRQGTSNFFQADFPEVANNVQSFSPTSSSFIGGIHAGFNWQFARTWVIGIEGDWQPAHSRQSFCRQTDIDSEACFDNRNGFATVSDDIRLTGTARGRVGWALDQMMIYGTGGIAFGDVRTSLSLDCALGGCGSSGNAIATTQETSSHQIGWVAGGGIERMFGKNWIVRAEYLHINLGNVTNTLFLPAANCNGPPCGLSWSQEFRYDIVRAGVSYKFGGF